MDQSKISQHGQKNMIKYHNFRSFERKKLIQICDIETTEQMLGIFNKIHE